jgi:hypothetical protein
MTDQQNQPTRPAQKLAELREIFVAMHRDHLIGWYEAGTRFSDYALNNAPAIAARERELERERENYKFMYDKAIKAVDDAFQEYSGHDAILPDFLQPGDCKFTGVMKLANAYKEQRDQLAAKDAEIAKLRAENQTAARERELEEENATANREIDHRDGELAAACDMLNSWCRESGVEECSSPYEGLGLQKTIDRLWGCVNEKHYKQLTAKDAEIGGLAMLVLLLMRRLSTDASNDKLVSQAKDYLIRKGLQGSPLRESEATDER